MGSKECPTCMDEYDGGDHRVRMLQCGHSQCSSCMRAQFSNGRITCCTCRATHTYPSIESIPINYIAEKYKEEMENLKYQHSLHMERDAAPLTPKLNKGICEEHATVKLFWCNTHHEWICTHCSVTDHPRGECEIIPIRKQFEKDKDVKKSKICEELKNIDDTKNDVKLSIDEVDKQKEEKNKLIMKMKEEIEALKKQISQKENEISALHSQHTRLHSVSQECDQKKTELENVLTRFHNITTFKELDIENTKCESLINIFVNWTKGLKEDKDLSQLFKTKLPNMLEQLKKTTNSQEKKTMIDAAKKMIQHRLNKTKMFAKKKIGSSNYFSSIEERQGCIVINSLQPNLSLGTDSSLLEYDDVMRLTGTPPVIFLKLSYRDINLGDLHILLDGLPGQVHQFLELSTRSSGRGSYKGARIDQINNKNQPAEQLYCGGFLNASGETESAAICQVEAGTPGKTPIVEGVVLGCGGKSASFWIVTIGQFGTWPYPVIGHVTSGMPELKAAIKKYGDGDIVFTETGVVIDGSV